MQIRYFDRETNSIKEEKVAGEKYLRWLYENPLGQGLLEIFIKRKLFSSLYGKLQDLPFSSRKISNFVRDYGIDMSDYKLSIADFKTFNEFFYRELKEGARPVDTNPNRLISPADGRLLAFINIDPKKVVQVKGSTYALAELIGDEKLAREYTGGVCFIIRLCPVDYHRFHFPAQGISEASQVIKGNYYSVNPIALRNKAKLYCQNKRELTIFHSEHFGDILFLEVGATCVGSIVQTYKPQFKVEKGEEKGYFKFGGSTVVLFLKPQVVTVDEDLLQNTLQGIETKVKMGMGIATLKG
ncbi:MAG: phosphatidylserine decarboxylase [Peptococcales bacterium]